MRRRRACELESGEQAHDRDRKRAAHKNAARGDKRAGGMLFG